MDAIFTRRSIRKFTDEPVLEKMVENLLRAAMAAPSAGNQQPWQFVVIDDRGILDQVPEIHPYAQMVKQVPLAILVCGDLDREERKGFWVQDCSAATENILIEAEFQGLGAVWLGVYPREDRVKGLRKLLGIPKNNVPFSLIPIGHPGEHKPPSDRYDRARIHHNRWR